MVKRSTKSHKRSTTDGTTDKDVRALVGNIDGQRPVNEKFISKIKKELPAKGCCHKIKRERM
jgi:hypothetical protein